MKNESYWKEIVENDRNVIISLYEKSCVSDIMNSLYKTKSGLCRYHINRILKESGVFDPCSNAQKKVDKIKKTCIEKYGVDNISKLKPNKTISILNKLPIQKTKFSHDFDIYRYEVHKETTKNRKNLLVSSVCYYTGIEFSDNIGDCNPNCPFKRTLDHKISILGGFVSGIDPKNIGSLSNLVYCLREINSVKGSLSYDDPIFLQLLSKFYENN